MGIYSGVSLPATRAIVNGHSAGGAASGAMTFNGAQYKTVLSGSLTANTLATVLTVSGSGYCALAVAYAADTTSRTIRLQILIDGVTAFDATSSAITTASSGVIAVGSAGSNSGGSVQLQDGVPVRFNSSLVIKVASSLSETDNVTTAYKYTTE